MPIIVKKIGHVVFLGIAILLGAISYLYAFYPEQTYGVSSMYHISIIYGLIGIAILYIYTKISLEGASIKSLDLIYTISFILLVLFMIGLMVQGFILLDFVLLSVVLGLSLVTFFNQKHHWIKPKSFSYIYLLNVFLLYLLGVYLLISLVIHIIT